MTSNKWWTNFHLPWGFYEASPNASITAELLVAMIQFLDDLNVFNQTIAKSFLLLDGHHSRMSLPFLQYINDTKHHWLVCFGVPYATHVWKPNNAEGLNGKFKLELMRAKKSIYLHEAYQSLSQLTLHLW
jgi:hypothetical protein